ncbi:hypothetical protein M0R45_026362 [Rubus argutus]|uniref:Aspartic peptidase DDI1-type domain-containing protein n=1 Tax=Rubus argutus TaxID=59490 RepID=A0AAW1WXD3_RUBAR
MHKKKLQDGERFVLKEEVSAIIQRRVSPNIHDPTSFVIGWQALVNTSSRELLWDMGTNINIMPLATFRKLAIGSLQPTSISVQLADGTFRMPLGIVEDVLIRVGKFILPADFVILDMDEDPKVESGLPIILGRPFMAIAGAKINVQKGTVKLKVLGEKIKMQVLQPAFPQNVIKEVLSTDLVKGNQAKSERIFGPLNPPKPLDQDHSSVVAASQELQELSYLDDDDDDMFDEVAHLYMPDDKASIVSTPEFEPESFASPLPVHKTEVSLACVRPELDMDPHFMGQQTSSFEQVHQLDEFQSPQRLEAVQPNSTIHERDRGILPTPYIPPHRRMFMPTSYVYPHEHRLSSSFESFKMRSPPCNEVQLEAIQCLRDILGIGQNRVMTHECFCPETLPIPKKLFLPSKPQMARQVNSLSELLSSSASESQIFEGLDELIPSSVLYSLVASTPIVPEPQQEPQPQLPFQVAELPALPEALPEGGFLDMIQYVESLAQPEAELQAPIQAVEQPCFS